METNEKMIDSILKDVGNGKSVKFKYAGNEYFFKPEGNGKITITKNGSDSKMIYNNAKDVEQVLKNIINKRDFDYMVDTF